MCKKTVHRRLVNRPGPFFRGRIFTWWCKKPCTVGSCGAWGSFFRRSLFFTWLRKKPCTVGSRCARASFFCMVFFRRCVKKPCTVASWLGKWRFFRRNRPRCEGVWQKWPVFGTLVFFGANFWPIFGNFCQKISHSRNFFKIASQFWPAILAEWVAILRFLRQNFFEILRNFRKICENFGKFSLFFASQKTAFLGAKRPFGRF